jgi:GTP cyclohydrolase I
MGIITPPAQKLIEELLNGYCLTGENFEDTPRRFTQTLEDLIFRLKPVMTTFPLRDTSSMILIKDYVAWSLCPHHLLPVKYTFKIGYIPEERVLGLSKLARLADWVMSLLPLQEDIPALILKELEEGVKPKGCGCVVIGEHLCMRMRGVQSENTTAVSTGMRGCFLKEQSCREEFLSL